MPDFKVDIDILDGKYKELIAEQKNLKDLGSQLENALDALQESWDSKAREDFMNKFDKDYLKVINQYAQLVETMAIALNKAKFEFEAIEKEGKSINYND